ncbi:MAG: nucleotidyltransferase family protein [Bacteroidales bacterium]|nr:nucleotidyltransferase family protein [Bacteroidales bacterium]
MKNKNRNIDAFFALLRAGLWEQGVRLSDFAPVDYKDVYRLSLEQLVVGLVAAGLEQVEDIKFSNQDKLPFLKNVLGLETRNASMNRFIAEVIGQMSAAGIFVLVVKGQGIAQCYERPAWRASGDIDFFLDAVNYEKAKAFLIPMASSVEIEDKSRLHMGMTVKSWMVELHGTMNTGISSRIDDGIVLVQRDIFENDGIRVWHNSGIDVFLPSPDNDAIIVFTHFIEHFFVGGVGLRQISDWCRLLWTYRDVIDRTLLGRRLEEMRLMSEWKAFASFAVSWLGMPDSAMPFYVTSSRFERKARRICRIIIDAGNFGHNKDQSYRSRYPKLIEKSITFFRRLGEFLRLSCIFPSNTPRFFVTYVCRRMRSGW